MVVAVWVCLLDAASQHASRGVIAIDPEEIAVIQGMELAVVEAILQAFRDKGMIDKNSRLASWDKRQHMTSTERSQKQTQRADDAALAGRFPAGYRIALFKIATRLNAKHSGGKNV
jgi:hypothetical protein